VIRKIGLVVVKILISTLLIGMLLRQFGIRSIMDHMQDVNWLWLLGSYLVLLASYILGSVQWWVLLRSEGIIMAWRQALAFYFTGLFFNNFFIGNLGGDVYRMVDVRRYSSNGTGAVATVFLDRFMGFLVLSGFAVLTTPWVLAQEESPSSLRIFVGVLLVSWICILFILFNKNCAKPFAWLLNRLIPPKITAKGREVYQKIHAFGRDRKLFLQVLSISLIVQSARILVHYLIGRALGVTLPLVVYFLIIPIIATLVSLPISVGGIGIREKSGVTLFGMVGLAGVSAFSMEFIAYIVNICCSLPGIVFFIGRSSFRKSE